MSARDAIRRILGTAALGLVLCLGLDAWAGAPAGAPASAAFSLADSATGPPARLAAIAPQRRSTTVGSRFAQPLQVLVLDAEGNPVAGVAVTFALDAGGGESRCGTGTAASASFAGGATRATAVSGERGIAVSPAFTANSAAGSFTATASISSGGGTGAAEGGGEVGDPGVAPVEFSLVNRAGRPAKIAPGVGASQSTAAGSAFPIPLAVTVTDVDRNPVAGAFVTFAAPATGASGTFALPSHDSHRRVGRVSHPRTVRVRTGACGIAVAPPFTASAQPGGYVVQASAQDARPAAFALVNEPPGQSQ